MASCWRWVDSGYSWIREIARRPQCTISAISDEMLRTEESSLDLTLYRLEEVGWIREDVAKRLSAAVNRTFGQLNARTT
jgi:hypothetical protein